MLPFRVMPQGQPESLRVPDLDPGERGGERRVWCGVMMRLSGVACRVLTFHTFCRERVRAVLSTQVLLHTLHYGQRLGRIPKHPTPTLQGFSARTGLRSIPFSDPNCAQTTEYLVVLLPAADSIPVPIHGQVTPGLPRSSPTSPPGTVHFGRISRLVSDRVRVVSSLAAEGKAVCWVYKGEARGAFVSFFLALLNAVSLIVIHCLIHGYSFHQHSSICARL